MRTHINADGKFQSDKYPTCPPGKIPLSVEDASAQDLLWLYAQRRRAVDPEFSSDLEFALKSAGYEPPPPLIQCTCGANAACAGGVFGPPPHSRDCALARSVFVNIGR
jgi:hypothetical protein